MQLPRATRIILNFLSLSLPYFLHDYLYAKRDCINAELTASVGSAGAFFVNSVLETST